MDSVAKVGEACAERHINFDGVRRKVIQFYRRKAYEFTINFHLALPRDRTDREAARRSQIGLSPRIIAAQYFII